ncbi:flagellar hook assembly protein FlgD [Aquibacillus sediminis]|uniref:flagellar hook assembly protein FlgD n=1 Tax=Aquibacillus sediminis TaxID=2574734 RepID=UPI0011094486|nr:flagellar hook assembly protein FlgD [Aquibacillus sediminis]
MTKIDPSLYLNNQPRGTTNSELGKDEFLKILMTQLQNQDPSNPMEDKEFIAQMANFSTLEQMTNMSSSMDKLVENQSMSPILQYSHLIGKEVSYYRVDKETGDVKEPKEMITSVVKSVSQNEGQAVLELGNDTKIQSNDIVKVNEAPKQEPMENEENNEASTE